MADMRAPLTGTQRKDGRWQITLVLTRADGAKIRKTIYAPTQREVQAKAHDLLMHEGRVAHRQWTLEDLITAYKAERFPGLAEKTRSQYEWALGRIVPHMGKEEVRKIGPPRISRWLKTLALDPRLSGRSVQICRNVLRVLLGHAVELGWCETNAAKEVRLPVSAKPAPKPRLSPADYRAILESEEDPRWRALWMVLGETGMRPSEALALTRADLFYSGDLWWLVVVESKTEAGRGREVPVPDILGRTLTDWEGAFFPWDIHAAEKRWKKALAAAGVGHTNLYQLRKMCLSRWIAGGLPDDVVKELAGHTDIRLTLNVYNRVDRARLTEALWSHLEEARSVKSLSLWEPE
jgi:integrase